MTQYENAQIVVNYGGMAEVAPPTWVDTFAEEFYEQRSPSGAKVKDLGNPLTVLDVDGDGYTLVVSRNLWYDTDEWAYQPEGVDEVDVFDRIDAIESYLNDAFDQFDGITVDGEDCGDFYSLTVFVDVEQGRGGERGEQLMAYLPYDDMEEAKHHEENPLAR